MPSISEVVIRDHRALEEYYNEVLTALDLDHQERFGNQFTWELARHCTSEDLVLYPAVSRFLKEEWKNLGQDENEKHHELRKLLKQFQEMKPHNHQYVPKLQEIWTRLSIHMDEEVNEILPALETALQEHPGESEALAKKFLRSKMFAPTRSHPFAGEVAPLETVMGLMMTPIDHITDVFRKFPQPPVYDRSSV